MVNVPGRSKGCSNCRRRKIACDQRRPSCERCLKANLKCEGYYRERVFVDDPAAKKKTKERRKPSYLSLRSAPGSEENCSYGRYLDGQPKSLAAYPPPTLNADTLSYSSAYRAAFFARFITIPYRNNMPSAIFWLHPVPDLVELPPALEAATLALCTAYFARVTRNEAAAAGSLRLYGQGLRELRRSLADPKQIKMDETLATCLALGVYELVECPEGSKEAYRHHRDASARLVRLRGVEKCRSGWGRDLWRMVRIQSMVQALETRRTSFIMEDDWSDIPPPPDGEDGDGDCSGLNSWGGRLNGERRAMHRLLNLLGLVPAFLVRGENLKHLPAAKRSAQAKQMLRRCWAYDAELIRLRRDIEGGEAAPLWYRPLSMEESDSETELEEERTIEFRDMQTAEAYGWIWVLEMMLWSGMERLYNWLSNITPEAKATAMPKSMVKVAGSTYTKEENKEDDHDNNQEDDDDYEGDTSDDDDNDYGAIPAELDAHRRNWISSAHKICQSVDYCTRAELLGPNPPRIGFALGLTLQTLAYFDPLYRRETIWAKAELNKLCRSTLKFMVAKDNYIYRLDKHQP